MRIEHMPSAKAEMLIRKPVAEVFEAFVNPDITTGFWFTKSSGRLEAGMCGLKALLEHNVILNLIADRSLEWVVKG